jgi:hypothetical protein
LFADNEIREAAMVPYFKKWVIIPLRENSKVPNLPKGHDFLARRPTFDEYKGFNFYNYGIVTGPVSGICVMDIDAPEGLETLEKMEIDVGFWPTPKVITPNGIHVYFKYSPAIATGTNVIGDGIDIRSKGGYVVGPGSVVDGKPYYWSRVYGHDTELMDPPDFLMRKRTREHIGIESDWVIGEKIANGKRNDTLTSVAGTLIRRDVPYPVLVEMLNVMNNMMCDTPLDEAEVKAIATSNERYRDS